MKVCHVMVLVVGMLLASASPALATNNSKKNHKLVHYTVSEGDTLGSIALQFGVDFDDIRTWNQLDGLTVTPGEKIIVKSDEKPKKKRNEALPVIHVIRRGDTFEGIARKYRVKIKSVRRWNRRLNPRKLQIGQRVRLYIPGRDGKSASWGAASGGRLYNGVALRESPGLKVRNTARSYATRRTVRLLRDAIADVKARWSDAPALVAGDLSYKGGGHMRPHASHQSGRDADVSYYYRGNVQLPGLVRMTYQTLDVVKTWHLFKTLIDTGKVQYIFIDRPLQRALYDYARSIGYTPEQLQPLIQYPRPNTDREGIIRYARGHDTHFHIRFTCGPNDRHCD